MKEHKKLYKAGKNWVVATLAVASLGIVATQQQVSADSTTTDTVSATSENNSVQKAQQTKDQAQSAYDQQSQVVANAETAKSVAQSSADVADSKLAQAKTNAATVGATDENISSTSAAVNSQQAVVDNYKQQLNKGTQAQPGKTEVAKPSATNAQALNESIEQNQIKLPDGYVKAFNEQIAAIGYQDKNGINSNFDFNKSEKDIDAKEKTLQNIAKGLNTLNPYQHNENDSKVAIKDVYNLDHDVAMNLSLWYAGVLNNLVKKYDLKNVNGTLLRDVMQLKVTNYSLETATYINNEINKNTPKGMFRNGKSGAGSLEMSLVTTDDLNDQAPELNLSPRPNFMKAIDDAISAWGSADIINPQKITNLDELKEATWNKLILYNLLDSDWDWASSETAGNKGSSLKGDTRMGSLFGPALFMQTYNNHNINDTTANQYSVALAVNKGDQIIPHWCLVAKAYQGNKDNQPLKLSTAVNPQATSNGDVNVANLEKQYNQAKAQLDTLKAKLAQLQKAAGDVKTAQKNADDAHAKLNAAKQKLQQEQAKLATLKAALDKAVKNLNIAKAKASVNDAQAEYTKASNDYNAQKSVVNKDQAAVENAAKALKQATNKWSSLKGQQLQSFMDQFAKKNNMKFTKFDGKNAGNSMGPNYGSFTKYLVNGNKVTFGTSKDGQGTNDYELVALYNHNIDNAEAAELHDTYLFTFHNGKPELLFDRTTNGDNISTWSIDKLDSATVKKYHLAELQEEFSKITNNSELSDQLQESKDKLDKDQAKLAQLKQAMTNKKQALDNAEKNLNNQNNSNQDTDKHQTNNDSKGNNANNNQGSLTNIVNGKTDTSSTTNTANQQTSGTFNDRQVASNTNGKSVVNYTKDNKAQNNLNNNVVAMSTNPEVTSINTTEKANNTVTKFAANHEVATHQTTQGMTNTKQLPQTGNNDSAVAGLLGAALAMFGFGLLKKKHYEG
ncbi:DUF4767 domain-containing protein [Limosilactobacillus sp. STM2_1]|uniref:DUF4767 domain-containing protein n=1 Tax=Limosilactobacillus rudii TaxID=2759755 RepID=A0A7W3UM48_9LACO|nr:DUF4767 domain-containing protein [Limosilactobacillus rudii]MBB1079509.1 DUF4767 domain-containing protein [Limosilactobacillus rudii]MBB1097555.1 DUF4767 domain-containing protein [Limosilactobacillus rudii]MCD7134664.1 DUF4767 domain-containing protein [Limosilactobacillus rudii]